MTWEIAVVFAIVGGALALFIAERYSVDQVALAIPVILLLTGILTPTEAIAGLSHEATVTVAAMLALSLGLMKTGAVAAIGRWALSGRLGGPHARLIFLSAIVAAISPFLNNTAVVVIFLPVFMAVAHRADQPPSLYLMPLSFSAILGGTVSLIGTSTNLVVYGMARDRGFEELAMFSIAPLGLIYLGVGFLYMFTIGRALLPRRRGEADLSGKYAVREFVTELSVTPASSGIGKTYTELKWGERYGVSVIGVQRDDRTIWGPVNRRLRVGDLLYAQGSPTDLLKLAQSEKLGTPAHLGDVAIELSSAQARLAEVLVTPNSPLAGRTLKDVRFQQRYDITVLAVQHQGRTLRERLALERIEPGDLLLVHGETPALHALAETPGFVLLAEVDRPLASRPRAMVSVLILVGVVVVAGLQIAPVLTAALVGVLLMIFTRCVTLEEMYDEMDWMVVFLLAGVIPLGLAMDKTGAAAWLGHLLGEAIGPLGPRAGVAAFYLTTSILTEIMSNNAAAVVLTPIAIVTAEDLGMNPYALLIAVMFGASASFTTPIGYQTNTLIYGPGGYLFSDFLRVGGPLGLLLLATAAIFIPIFWPS